jgi:hypothetical protein
LKKKLYSASDISKMGLPGLPSSRDNIRKRAENEGWYREEQKGRGGTRWVYEIPGQYTEQASTEPEEVLREEKVAGVITPGERSVDLATIKFVDEVLEEWLQKKGLRLKPGRRAGILAVLCDYLAKGATEKDLQEMLKVLSA